MPKMDSFLIINPYGIGDVLFSTPLISSIKAHNPNARIYYLCNQRTFDIIRDNADIIKAFIYDRDAFILKNAPSFWVWIKKWKNFIGEIRRAKISVAIDLSLNTGIGAIPFFAGIHKRVGLNYKKRGRFLTDAIAIDGFEGRHVAEHYLMVLDYLGIPKTSTGLTIGVNAEAKAWADGFIKDHGIGSDECVIGIAPCGGQAFGPQANIKRWPEENFSELINGLIEKYQCKVLLFAGPNEEEEISRILSGVKEREKCFALTQISLLQCVPLIDRCDLFIGNDTGVLRFADALRKKIIAFFGPTDEVVYGLYPFDPSRHAYMFADVDCRPCYRKFRLPECQHDRACLKNVEVDEVIGEAGRLLHE